MYTRSDMGRMMVPDDGRLLTYGKFDEWNVRNYSLELANCEEDDVPDMIDEWYKPDEVTFEDLWEMGWDGDISNWRDAKMYDFSSGQLIKREAE